MPNRRSVEGEHRVEGSVLDELGLDRQAALELKLEAELHQKILAFGRWPTQRGFRCVGSDAADVSGFGSGVPPGRGWNLGWRFPASELAGYFRGSLRDLLCRCAPLFHHILA